MKTLLRYLKLQFSKPELDWFSTVLGLTITITTVLTVNEVIDKKTGTVIAGVAGSLVSVLINNPASVSPTTEETEDKLQKEE